MPKYQLDQNLLQSASRFYVADSEQIKAIIFENNTIFKTFKDEYGTVVIECENKPRDAVLLGIRWLEWVDPVKRVVIAAIKDAFKPEAIKGLLEE